MAIWFTSDTHFNHANIIEYSLRPFDDLDDMTETMIARWNAVVNHSDTVYHLGDFALSWGKKHKELCDSLLERLHGQKWLIVGNHDRDEVVKNPRWHNVTHYHEIKLDLGGEHKQRIIMSHYPFRSWNQMHRGAWMLHGHSHGNLTDIGGKTLDVGVDVHGYAPVSVEAVKAFMDGRTVVECDHHSSVERPVITEERKEIMSEPNKPTTVPSVHDIVLLPCPFCGGDAEPCYQRDDLGDWKVECKDCGAVSCPDGTRYDKSLAIKDWNTRIICDVKLQFRFECVGKLVGWFASTDFEMFGPHPTLLELQADIRASLWR